MNRAVCADPLWPLGQSTSLTFSSFFLLLLPVYSSPAPAPRYTFPPLLLRTLYKYEAGSACALITGRGARCFPFEKRRRIKNLPIELRRVSTSLAPLITSSLPFILPFISRTRDPFATANPGKTLRSQYQTRRIRSYALFPSSFSFSPSSTRLLTPSN